MYQSIRRIYIKTGNKDYVISAYNKGWITEEQKDKILAIEFDN
jgi:hypothetical protein